ncbi:nucleoporin Nup120/160-domain-containing protein [Dipodascopsis uninucleata]
MAGQNRILSFKETCVRVDDAIYQQYPAVKLTVPDSNSDATSSRQKRHRHSRHSFGMGSSDTEEEYSRRHIALQSSIFFRSANVFPRMILWRVVAHGTVLVLSGVDPIETLDKNSNNLRDIHVTFPTSIKQSCVVLNDSKKNDALVVDVLTESHVLYTLKFASSMFFGEWIRKPTDEWCHLHSPAHFSLRFPHSMKSLSERSLIVSLLDGGLLRLDRPDALSENYKERIFSDGSYLASLKGMFLWGGKDRVRGHPNISTNLVVSLAVHEPNSTLLTLSINNILRSWSLQTLTLIETYNLALRSDEENFYETNNSKSLIDIDNTGIMTTAQLQSGMLVAAYCPLGDGNIRFWKLESDRSKENSQLQELIPNGISPVAPDDNAIWMISGLLLDVSSRSEKVNLWLMWKSNKSTKIHVMMDILEYRHKKLSWTTVAPSGGDALGEIGLLSSSSSDITDRYLSRIFRPGVFSRSIVEAVLPIFEQHYYADVDTKINDINQYDSNIPLKEKAAHVVGAAVILQQKFNDGSLDYESYNRDLLQQWVRFERLCVELSKQGSEVLSFTRDPHTSAIYVIKATAISIIRSTIGIEYIDQVVKVKENMNSEEQGTLLLQALLTFRELLPQPVIADFLSALVDDSQSSANFSIGDRINTIYDLCLSEQIADSAIDLLHRRLSLIQDLSGAMEACYKKLSSVSSNVGEYESRNKQHSLTEFGNLLLCGVITDSISAMYERILDIMLFLTIFDLDVSESHYLDHIRYYQQFLILFRNISSLKLITEIPFNFNSRPYIMVPEKISSQSSVTKLVGLDSGLSRIDTSVLGFLLANRDLPANATCASRLHIEGTAGPSRAAVSFMAYWRSSDEPYSIIAAMSHLLASGDIVSTAHLIPYLPSTGLTCYMKGRIYLEQLQYEKASILFLRSSNDLSHRRLNDNEVLSLYPICNDKTKVVLGTGQSSFYSHVSKLFYDKGAFTKSVEFARLAIDSLEPLSKSLDDMLVKYFDAALRAALYDESYMALNQIRDQNEKLRCLRSLIIALSLGNRSAQLCKYPFIGMHKSVEEILMEMARNTIDVNSIPNYYKVFYSWQIEHGNYREACASLYEYVQRLKSSGFRRASDKFNVRDLDISQCYMILINTMMCIDDEIEPWFLARKFDSASTISSSSLAQSIRTLIRLSDIKSEYNDELLRMEKILQEQLAVIDV